MSTKITVKLLVGDLMEIELPHQVTYDVVYELIRENIPADIRPIYIEQMNLMFGEELVPIGKEIAVMDQEAVYLLLLDAERYTVSIGVNHNQNTVNVEEGDVEDYVPISFKLGRVVDDSYTYFMEEFHLYERWNSLYVDLNNVAKHWHPHIDYYDEETHLLILSEPLPTARRSNDEMIAFFVTQIQRDVELSLAAIRFLSEEIRKDISFLEEGWHFHHRYRDGDFYAERDRDDRDDREDRDGEDQYDEFQEFLEQHRDD